MRNFSPTLMTLLKDKTKSVKFFLLIQLNYKISRTEVETLRFTTYPSTLYFDGQTYNKDVGLSYYEAPKFNSVIDKNSYKISLIDNSGIFFDSARFGFVGQPLKLWVGFVDGDGVPDLSVDNVPLVYSGYVDGVSAVNDFESKVIHLEGSSPMADLDLVNLFMVSKNGMDQKSKTDTAFDNIFTDNDISIKWGKI